ncbi:hypothetical protein JF66_01060 [Cryobacterium sp. MLB-32]|uniref:hypothetical protein n=1 Tax=Cryobacterium sp. MLB-32 TaxID=1529318 RepID=UPI0004E62E56|nr:hypothetical protein [Cryobacterium sp. MLB-32]KFF60968.1 hypothetical protein JF66_01060 [Cryobacterium sp. MLB-32]
MGEDGAGFVLLAAALVALVSAQSWMPITDAAMTARTPTTPVIIVLSRFPRSCRFMWSRPSSD